MLEMVFLVISYIETVGVKWPGRKKIFCLLSDTLLYNVNYSPSHVSEVQIFIIIDEIRRFYIQ